MMIDQRSQKQKEDESREEGLRTNLIARDTMEGESKALRMMKSVSSLSLSPSRVLLWWVLELIETIRCVQRNGIQARRRIRKETTSFY